MKGQTEEKGPTVLSQLTYQWIKEHFLIAKIKQEHSNGLNEACQIPTSSSRKESTAFLEKSGYLPT